MRMIMLKTSVQLFDQHFGIYSLLISVGSGFVSLSV